MNKKAQLGLGAIFAGILTIFGIILKNPFVLLIAGVLFLFSLGFFSSLFLINIPMYIWVILGVIMIFWIINMGKNRR